MAVAMIFDFKEKILCEFTSLSLLLVVGRVQFDDVGGVWRLSKKERLCSFCISTLWDWEREGSRGREGGSVGE